MSEQLSIRVSSHRPGYEYARPERTCAVLCVVDRSITWPNPGMWP
jgi:hypothetical protein